MSAHDNDRTQTICATVTTKADGSQTIKLDVPADMVPEIVRDIDPNAGYHRATPVRLFYKVGLTETAKAQVETAMANGESISFLTNRYNITTSKREDSAGAVCIYEPAEENPYYSEENYGSTDPTNEHANPGDITRAKITEDGSSSNRTGTNPYFYERTVNRDTDGNITTVNNLLFNEGKLTFTPSVTSYTVKKTWNGPASSDITVQLYKSVNGHTAVPVEGKTAVLNQSNSWTYTFTGLPANDIITENGIDGKDVAVPITYSVREIAIDGNADMSNYDTQYLPLSASIGTNIVNTEMTTVSGEKTWEDANDQDGKRPANITVTLYQSVNGATPAPVKNGSFNVVQVVSPDANGKWKYDFGQLPKYNESNQLITYSVVEAAVNGYTTTYSETVYDILNSRLPETVTVSGTKTWNDNNDETHNRPAQITVQLYADDAPVSGRTATVTAPNWNYSFTDLPKYKDGGDLIVYTVKENDVPNYTVSYPTGTYNIVNDYTPDEVVDIPVQKVWEDRDDQDGKRPDAITVQLYESNTAVTGKTLTLDEDNDWRDTFRDLPVFYGGHTAVYTVRESTVLPAGYTSAVTGTAATGFIITNSYTPETTSVSGEKFWVGDDDDADGNRPESVIINLLADGTEVGQRVVDESTHWAWSFENLPVYKDGSKIRYTVEEDVVVNYDVNYTITTDGFDVTNTYNPVLTEITGVKTWADSFNKLRIRPASITIRLLADGVPVDSVTVTEKDEWKWAFEDLNAYANGKLITYSVREDAVPGYTTAYDQKGTVITVTNSIIPNAPKTGAENLTRVLCLTAITAFTACGFVFATRRRKASK